MGLFLAVPAAALQPAVLVVYDSSNPDSWWDHEGIVEALAEARMPYVHLDLAGATLTSTALEPYPVAVLSHVELSPAEAGELTTWVERGRGLLASGRTADEIEALLGVTETVPFAIGGATVNEVRFTAAHPATTGSFWDGAITRTPPTPPELMPLLVQLHYLGDGWSGREAVVGTGTPLARWRRSQNDAPEGGTAVVAHTPRAGRTVYSGALPGMYAQLGWPEGWRTFILSAVHWLAGQQVLVELGYWPDAHRAALAWTGDAAEPAMVTAVPDVIDVFQSLGLSEFGTFYIVGKKGGDPGYEGALEHPDVVEWMALSGSEVGGHGDVHSAFRGQSLNVQTARLQEMLDIIDPLLEPYGEAVRGFRAPYVDRDDNTFLAMQDVGLEYDAGELDAWVETTLPHVTHGVWQLPPAMPMDYTLFVYPGGVSDADAEALYLDKLAYFIARRGLFSWLCHPEYLAPQSPTQHLGVLDAVLRWAGDRGDVWLARQDAILDWWIGRESLTVESAQRVGGQLEVTVRNAGTASIAGASLWIRPAGTGTGWDGQVGGVPVTLAVREHAGIPFQVAVLPEVSPGSTLLLVAREPDIFADGFETGAAWTWGGP